MTEKKQEKLSDIKMPALNKTVREILTLLDKHPINENYRSAVLMAVIPYKNRTNVNQKSAQKLLQIKQELQNKINDFDAKQDNNKNEELKGYTQNSLFQNLDIVGLEDDDFIYAHTDNIYDITQLDAKTIATCSRDKKINIWNIETAQLIKTLEGHKGSVVSLLKISDKLLASASEDKTIKIWDITTGNCIRTLTTHTNHVNKLLLLNKQTFISCSRDKTIKFWDIKKWICTSTLQGNKSSIWTMCLKGSTTLITGNEDNKIKIWDIASGQCVNTLTGHDDSLTGIAVLDDKQIVSSSKDGTVRLWNTDSGDSVIFRGKETHNGRVTGITVLLERYVLSIGYDDKLIVWDSKTCKSVFSMQDKNTSASRWRRPVMLLQDNRIITTGKTNGKGAIKSYKGYLQIYNPVFGAKYTNTHLNALVNKNSVLEAQLKKASPKAIKQQIDAVVKAFKSQQTEVKQAGQYVTKINKLETANNGLQQQVANLLSEVKRLKANLSSGNTYNTQTAVDKFKQTTQKNSNINSNPNNGTG